MDAHRTVTVIGRSGIHADGKIKLNDVMEFDHPIQVNADGTVEDASSHIYAPSLYDGELDDGYQGQRWTLMNGYSGQYMYSGPIMHNAEFIGGKMADDILSEPGIYVALVNYSLDDDLDAEGWAVAKLK